MSARRGAVTTCCWTIPAGGTGPKPIELVAVALAGCTAFDVITILRQKYHQKVTGYEVRVEADQAERPPQVFTAVRIVHSDHRLRDRSRRGRGSHPLVRGKILLRRRHDETDGQHANYLRNCGGENKLPGIDSGRSLGMNFNAMDSLSGAMKNSLQVFELTFSSATHLKGLC